MHSLNMKTATFNNIYTYIISPGTALLICPFNFHSNQLLMPSPPHGSNKQRMNTFSSWYYCVDHCEKQIYIQIKQPHCLERPRNVLNRLVEDQEALDSSHKTVHVVKYCRISQQRTSAFKIPIILITLKLMSQNIYVLKF